MKSFIIIYICIMTMVNNNIGKIYKPETITEVTTETITKNNNKNLEDEVLNISDNENIYNNNVLSGDGFFIDKSEYNIYNHLYYTLYGQRKSRFWNSLYKTR